MEMPGVSGKQRKDAAIRSEFESTKNGVSEKFNDAAAAPQVAAKEDVDFNASMEAFRIRAKKFMSSSIFGKSYDNCLLVLSVLSCLQFIYQTYIPPEGAKYAALRWYLSFTEMVLAGLFSFDWVLNFSLADHKWEHVNSFFSMVDLFTVVPIWVTFNTPQPLYTDIDNFQKGLVYCLYGFNTTRILRALRIHKKLLLVEDEVSRSLGDMLLTLFCMILFNSALMQFLEAEFQPLPYHSWMYCIWITTATVGYGDISPVSTCGRIAVMVMIAFAIITVPKMTNELLAKMEQYSVYSRLYYVPKKGAKHILICGDMLSTSLHEFFSELFHEDHENSNLIAVVLQPDMPASEMRDVLSDPTFSLSIFYMQGSALSERDLKRCCVDRAVAVFIMTNKFSTVPDEEDAKTILQQFSIKRFCQSNPFNAPMFCLQLVRLENRRHLDAGSDPLAAGVDEDKNLIICLNEIKMGVVARSILSPGTNTLILNLLTSFADDGEEEEEEEDNTFGGIGGVSDVGKDENEEVGNWLDEYQRGCDWEIYTTELAEVYCDTAFAELALSIYQRHGVVLFALQVKDLSGKCPTRTLLNPKNYSIPSKEEFFVLGFVFAKNKKQSDLSNQGESSNSIENNQLLLSHLALVGRGGVIGLDNGDHHMLEEESDVGIRKEDKVVDNDDDPATVLLPWQKLLRKYDVEKSASESQQERLQKLEDNHLRTNFFVNDFPANLADVTINTSLSAELPHVDNHLIIIGKGLSNLYDLIRPLRAKTLGSIKCIVILHPLDIPHAVWQRISIFQAIFVVRGSSLEENDLRRAGIFRAQQVVVLADTIDNSSSGSASSGIVALVDADSIFSYQAVKRLNEHAHCVVEIVRQDNVGYLDTENSNSGETNYRFSPQFAGGALFTSSLLDTLVCQAFYNPQIIKIINKIISGSDHRDVGELTSMYSSSTRKPKGLAAVVSSALYQTAIPDGLESRTYGALFKYLSKRGIIPLGLYRGVFPQMKVGPKANKMSYVFTNPSKDTELFSCDRVFMLASTPPAGTGNSKVSMKETLLLQEDIEMKMRNNASHASAAIREDFAVLEAAQVKMHQQLQHFQTDINKQMSSVMHVLHELNDDSAFSHSSQIHPEPAAAVGNRYRAQSANVNVIPGPPPTEFTLSSPPTAGNRNRAQSASISGLRGRTDSMMSTSSTTRERSRSSIRESFVSPQAGKLQQPDRWNANTNMGSFEPASPKPNTLTSDALKRQDDNLEDDKNHTGAVAAMSTPQLRINSRRSSNVSDGGLSTSGNGPVGGARRMSRPAARGPINFNSTM